MESNKPKAVIPNIEPNYKDENEQLIKKLAEVQGYYEKKLKETDEYWKTVTEASSKEIEWLKSIINGILHI